MKKKRKSFVDIKKIIISIILIVIISILVIFLLNNKSDKESTNEEKDTKIPEGCVACSTGSGICCPIAEDSVFKTVDLTELEEKLGCVKCGVSLSVKCCTVKEEDVKDLNDWCLVCSLTGDICCPVTAEELGLTQDELEKGCWVCEEDGTVCCPDE